MTCCPGTRRLRPCAAFTLVELLVVLAIIGILVALLLPAVQQVRESANRASCINKLKQLALAAHHHHDVRDHFPPGVCPVSQSGTPLDGRTTLFVELLPFLEQDNLHGRWDYHDYRNNLAGGTNATAAQVLKILICPSDALPDTPLAEFPADAVAPWTWGAGWYAVGSYGGNGGTLSFDWGSRAPSRDGVFFDDSRVRITDLTDGSSSTFLFGERSHRDPEFDRLTRAYDPVSSPLSGWTAWASAAWDVNSLGDVTLSSAVPINWMVPPGSGPDDMSWEWRRLCAFGSGHPGGANFALADGSVRFVGDTIPLNLLQGLSTRGGGEIAEVP